MKRPVLYIFFLSFVFTCKQGDQNAEFRSFAKAFYETRDTLWASIHSLSLPYKLDIPDQERIAQRIAFCKERSGLLKSISPSRLNTPFKFEHAKITSFIDNQVLKLADLRVYETDPTVYNVYPFFRKLLQTENTENRVKQVKNNLILVPRYFEAAKQHLKFSGTSQLNEALQEQETFYKLLQKQVADLALTSGDKALEEEAAKAEIAVKDFIAYLNSLKFEQAERSIDSLQRLSPFKKRKKAKRK